MSIIKHSLTRYRLMGRKFHFTLLVICTFVIAILFGISIGSNKIETRETSSVSLDSLSKVLENRIRHEKLFIKHGNGTADVAQLERKLDSLGITLEALRLSLSEIENMTSDRYDDMRAENDFFINKFNSYLSWWLLMLGILCGLAPLALSFFNYKNSEDYLNTISKSIESYFEEWIQNKDDINKLKEDTKEFVSEQNRLLDSRFKSIKEEMRLNQIFFYISTITQRTVFQQSPYRDTYCEYLMRTFLIYSHQYITSDNNRKSSINLRFWLFTTIDCLEMLRPFIRHDRYKLRRTLDLVRNLTGLRDSIFSGNSIDSQTENINESIELLAAIKRLWRPEENN